MGQEAHETVLAQYIELCKNPLRGPERIKREYGQLVSHPLVRHVGFYKPAVLMVGIDDVIIRLDDKRYNIGQMIIWLVRSMEDGMHSKSPKCGYYFSNATKIVRTKGGSTVHHPHVYNNLDGKEFISEQHGSLCINTGDAQPILNALKVGNLASATTYIIDVLHTYPTGCPYASANLWPLYTGET